VQRRRVYRFTKRRCWERGSTDTQRGGAEKEGIERHNEKQGKVEENSKIKIKVSHCILATGTGYAQGRRRQHLTHPRYYNNVA